MLLLNENNVLVRSLNMCCRIMILGACCSNQDELETEAMERFVGKQPVHCIRASLGCECWAQHLLVHFHLIISPQRIARILGE